MADLVLFKPRRDVDAESNLKAFIAHGRNLTVFGSDLDFDGESWNVTKWIPIKGKGEKQLRAVFRPWDAACRVQDAPMPEPFRSFAKAYFRYQHAMRPTKVIGFRIAALRALCLALEEHGSADPSSADVGVFNRAAQVIASHLTEGAAYRVAGQLEMVGEMMDTNRLAALPLMWRNPLKRPANATARIGPEFDAKREEMLPSAYSLDALARAFRAATEPCVVVVTSVSAIMCSAPDRVNEVLGLREDCEHRQKRSGEVSESYGLRFWPSKGADPMIKWVVPSMRSVVEEALNRLRDVSKEARNVALWYEKNPTALYLPPALEHLRRKPLLSKAEIGEVVFATPVSVGSIDQWCERNRVAFEKLGKSYVARFADVERAVLKLLPEGFPVLDVETGLEYSKALCIMRRNELHETRAVYRGVIYAVDQALISDGLGGHSVTGFRSVFDRLKLFEPDGSPIKIRTHQFRHYLNTLAHMGGLSELEIAKWSGRKDVGQNSAYNHMSDRDVQARLADLLDEDAKSTGREIAQVRINLIPRAKFAQMGIQAAHTTDFGFCAHDYALSPCQAHMDCSNCNEQVCIKGDEVGEANARSSHEETRLLLEHAEAAEREQSYGATNWVRHQRLTLERLTQLLQILDDPRVPPGAIIRLTHIKPASRLEQAASARELLDTGTRQRLIEWRVEWEGAPS